MSWTVAERHEVEWISLTLLLGKESEVKETWTSMTILFEHIELINEHFNTRFVSSHIYQKNPESDSMNRRLYEHGICNRYMT